MGGVEVSLEGTGLAPFTFQARYERVFGKGLRPRVTVQDMGNADVAHATPQHTTVISEGWHGQATACRGLWPSWIASWDPVSRHVPYAGGHRFPSNVVRPSGTDLPEARGWDVARVKHVLERTPVYPPDVGRGTLPWRMSDSFTGTGRISTHRSPLPQRGRTTVAQGKRPPQANAPPWIITTPCSGPCKGPTTRAVDPP
jgi:hypothetical protein